MPPKKKHPIKKSYQILTILFPSKTVKINIINIRVKKLFGYKENGRNQIMLL
jgi:hypothetical protein